MKILLSGASSFTGFWFARELRASGHQVCCLFQASAADDYQDLRGWRVATLCREGESAFACPFGSERFLQLIAAQKHDVYCHHAADVSNYRSPDFDVVRALERNTKNLRQVLKTLKESGCHHVVMTGSVFEGGEGAGSQGLPHILPYGLSKALTSQVFQYEVERAEISLAKFVIPNPFGSYQEPRFVEYLLGKWKRGEVAGVATPAYVRDNIHVGLLACDYRHFIENLKPAQGCLVRRSPSGIVGDMGSFAHLVAREMRQRLGWECALELARQQTFEEPRIRINTDPAAPRHPDWNEVEAWDMLARKGEEPS